MPTESSLLRRSFGVRALGALAAAAALLWNALPAVRRTVDDTYISAAYAWRIVEGHGWTWGTGEHVDGVSSPLHLAFMLAVAGLGGDIGTASRALSLGCGVAIVAVFAWRDLRVAFALAACSAFAYWSGMTMETMLASAVGGVGWTLSRSRVSHAWGSVGLTLFALCRPEGVFWLLVGARGGGRIAGVLVWGFAVGVHFWWFGTLFPTALAVKVVGGAFRDGGWQLVLGELIGVAGVLLAAWRRKSGWWLDAVPLAVGLGCAIAVGADWMGHGRLLLPGVVATVGAWVFGARRGDPARRVGGWWIVPLIILGGVTETDVGHRGIVVLRTRSDLLRPWRILTEQQVAPQLADVLWIAANVPWGGRVMTSDVGMPGNLADIGVFDLYGLVDLEVARDGARPEMARFRLTSARGAACLRTRRSPDPEAAPDLPEWRPAGYSLSGAYIEEDWATEWWCRPGTERPTPEQVRDRLTHLAARFPSFAAQFVAAGSARPFEPTAWERQWAERTAFVGARYVEGRGFPLYANGELRSHPVQAGELLVLDVDAPGAEGAEVVVGWEGQVGPGTTVLVRQRGLVPLPDGAGPGSRLIVRFTNDKNDGSGDRNVYVGLVRPP